MSSCCLCPIVGKILYMIPCVCLLFVSYRREDTVQCTCCLVSGCCLCPMVGKILYMMPCGWLLFVVHGCCWLRPLLVARCCCFASLAAPAAAVALLCAILHVSMCAALLQDFFGTGEGGMVRVPKDEIPSPRVFFQTIIYLFA